MFPFQLVVDTFENLVRCRLVDRSPGLCHVSPWGRAAGLVNFLEEGSRALFLTRHYRNKGSRQRCAEGGSWSVVTMESSDEDSGDPQEVRNV